MSAPLPPLPPGPADGVRKLSPQRQLLIGAVFVGVLALIGIATKVGGGPTYVTLFRDLDVSHVGEMTAALDKGNIKYQLESGGSEIRVAPTDLARARVLLAKDGMPNSGKPGLELFDKQSLGMTDFSQRVTYRRALEGELARTIGGIRGVESARVHLALPESSPLRRLERPAEAAVVLTLRGGQPLTSDQVQGIAYIVSNAVEQLPSENVAVMDDAGHILSAPADAGMAGLTSRQMEMQRTVEQGLRAKAEELLGTVVGVGNARVQVAAVLNFDQSERTLEQYDPDKQVLQNEQKSETVGDSSGAGGQTIIANTFQNSKLTERSVGAIGGIRKLTVAVLVDEAALSKEAAKVGATQDAQLAALEAAVKNGLGVDSTRGDRITVTALPFEPAAKDLLAGLPADTTKPKTDVLVIVERFSKPGLILAGLVVALVLGLRILGTPVRGAPAAPSAVAAGTAPAGLATRAEQEALESGDAAGALPPVSASSQLAAPQSSESRLLREAVAREASSETETVAQVVRAWLAER